MIIKARKLAATLGRALQLVWRSSPRLTLAQSALATTQALVPLVTLYALKRAVDAAAAVVQALPGGRASGGGAWNALLHNSAGQEVAAWFVVGAAAMGANACLRALAAWIGEQHAMAVSDHVHDRLHRKLLSVDLAFFENSRDQDRLHLAQAQAMTRPISVLDSVFQMLQGAVGLAGVLVLLSTLHPLVAGVLALAGVPALFFRLQHGQRLYEWRRDLAPLEREAGYFHHLLTDGDYAKELRLQGHGGFCRARFEAVRARLREARLVWRRAVLSRELAMQFVMLAIVAALFLWMTGQLLAGALTLGALVMYVQAVQRGQGQLVTLVAAGVELHQSALFLQAFDELMALPGRVVAPAAPRAVPAPLRRGIVFEQVEFTYPGTARPVLRGLSFEIRPNEHVALVGANGAGKTTLVKLLCRLYDPTAGRILVDGVDLRDMDPAAWRRHIGVLFQDFGRYQLTVAENVWIGDPQGSPEDPRIAATVERAGLDEVLKIWPQGLATPLGRWLHEGTEPSAGQWQRIALARAMLRDAGLLIMDEPTSSLDASTQREVIRMLQTAATGRAVLMVSHRPEMLAWTQRVIVLRDGAVVEEGPEALLRNGHGEFSRLFSIHDPRPTTHD
ncbi:MAG: ABC transporter ATP-binding protein [bacterium]